MDGTKILAFLHLAERLKCNTRHACTSSGREESVAEHTYRLCVFAWLLQDEFPDLDMNKVLRLCLFHDIGEAITGDVPCFEKGQKEQALEQSALVQVTEMLSGNRRKELASLLEEIEENKTPEAKLMQALDKMEAVIQHNESDISTWLPLEYDLQQTYGVPQAAEFPVTNELRQMILKETLEKIQREKD